MIKLHLIAFAGVVFALTTFAVPELKFESLGNPIDGHGIAFFGKTKDNNGKQTLWAVYSSSERFGLLGVDSSSGETQWYSLKKYGPRKIEGIIGPDNQIYIFCGRKSTHFLRFNPLSKKWTDLGTPAQDCWYFLSSILTPDGKFIVGTYPNAELVWADIHTDKIGSYGRIDDNKRNKYIISVKQDKSGIIYLGTGLYRQRVWSYDTQTGEKKQILPDNLANKNGHIELFVGEDGNVYGKDKTSGSIFLCEPEKIKLVKEFPRKKISNIMVGNFKVVKLSAGGDLILQNTKDNTEKSIKTEFKPSGSLIYSIYGGLDNKVWLGSFGPAKIAFLTSPGKSFVNIGCKTRGSIQIYSMLETARGLFVSSYTTGSVNLIDLKDKKYKSKLLVTMDNKYKQERIFRLVEGHNDMIYGCTMPSKGLLGGGILSINSKTLKCDFSRNIIFEQSIMDIATTQNGLLLGASSTKGGTSAIPSQKEAVIFLWDPVLKKIVWQEKPVKGETQYYRICPIGGNIFCIVAYGKRKCVFVNVKTRKVTSIIGISGKPMPLRLAGSAPDKLGPKAYLLNNKQVLEVDYKKSKIKVIGHTRNKVESGTYAEWVSPDGILYLGEGSQLWKTDLSKVTK